MLALTVLYDLSVAFAGARTSGSRNNPRSSSSTSCPVLLMKRESVIHNSITI